MTTHHVLEMVEEVVELDEHQLGLEMGVLGKMSFCKPLHLSVNHTAHLLVKLFSARKDSWIQ
jgi:hypothetical protein